MRHVLGLAMERLADPELALTDRERMQMSQLLNQFRGESGRLADII